MVKRVTVIERTHVGFMGFLTVEDEAGESVTLSELACAFAGIHVGDCGTITRINYFDGPAWVYEPREVQDSAEVPLRRAS